MVAKVFVHGVVNGAMAVVQGGNFAVGFLTGAVGKIGGLASQGLFGKVGTGTFGKMLGRTFMAAASGCAGAVIAGGKCANGAVTAAFAHLFNAERNFWSKMVEFSVTETKQLYCHSRTCAKLYATGKFLRLHQALKEGIEQNHTTTAVLLAWSTGGDGLFTMEPGWRYIFGSSSRSFTGAQKT